MARGVPEEERVRIDSHEIDSVLWMKVEDVRRDLSKLFAERSKIAWALYERDVAPRVNNYAPKYFKKDS